MAEYVARWDCACGTSNSGDDIRCACGRVQPENTRFYLPENTPAITDPSMMKGESAPADKHCVYCDTRNDVSRSMCSVCGGSLAEARQREVIDYDSGEVPTSGSDFLQRGSGTTRGQSMRSDHDMRSSESRSSGEDLSQMRWTGSGSSVSNTFQSTSSLMRDNWKVILGVVAIISVIGGILFFLLRTKTIPVSITSFSWERTIDIERDVLCHEEGWSVPSGGSVTSSKQKVHHHNKVQTGTKSVSRTVQERVQVGTERYVCGKRDLGNGRFADKYCTRSKYAHRPKTITEQVPVYKDVPVYRTWYSYDIWRWKYNRTEKSNDVGREPRWPDIFLGDKERESQRTERYHAHLKSLKKGDQYTHTQDHQDQWLTFDTELTYLMTINGAGVISKLELPNLDLESR